MNIDISRAKFTLSLVAIIAIVTTIFTVATAWAEVQAKIQENTEDITEIKLILNGLEDELKGFRGDLNITNENMVELTTILKQRTN